MLLFSRTDLGILGATYVIDLPELVYDEKDPILYRSDSMSVIRDPETTDLEHAPRCKGRRLLGGLFVSSLDTYCMDDGTHSTSCDLSKRTGAWRKTR